MSSTTSTELPLEQYAGIVVALDEGHPLTEVLEQEQVPAAVWDDIDIDFKDRLSKDGELFSEYAALVVEAEDNLHREVSPLEEDPVAYLSFMAHVAASDAALILDRHALTLADIGRLGRHWERRFAADEALRSNAFAQAERAAAPEAIQVAIAELRPFRWTPPAGPAPPPDASVAEHDLGATIDPSELPSAYGPTAFVPPASPPARARLEPNPRFGETAPLARRSRSPATPFVGRHYPPRRVASSLEPHPELGATAPLQRQRTPLEPNPTLAETAPLTGDVPKAELPFEGENPAPATTALEPHPALGATAPVRPKNPAKTSSLEPNPELGRTVVMPQPDEDP